MASTDLGNLTDSGGTLFSPTDGYSVSNLYKQVYTDLIRLQIQQYDSVLSDTLMGEVIEGEVKSFDKYLKHDVSKIKSRDRFGELGSAGNEYSATDSERRLIEPLFFEYAELFDPRDEVGLLRAIAPDGQYLRNIGAIFNQKKDLLILDALKNDVLVQTRAGDGVTANTTMAFGTVTATDGSGNATAATGSATVAANGSPTLKGSYEGFEIGCKLDKTGSGAGPTDKTPFVEYIPAATAGAKMKIAGVNAATEGANEAAAIAAINASTKTGAVTPMNIEKLIRARQKLDANNALMPGMPYICLMHPNNFYSLMSRSDDTRFTSIDFNEGKPLFGGEAFVFMGFQFRLSNLLPQIEVATANVNDGAMNVSAADTSGNALRYVYFYTPACGIFGMNAGMDIRFDEIPERGYALQMYHSVGMNGIRMDGDCMVRVACVDEGA